MGRAKREVPTGKLYLKYPRKDYDKEKKYTLHYYYSFNRKNMARDTQIKPTHLICTKFPDYLDMHQLP